MLIQGHNDRLTLLLLDSHRHDLSREAPGLLGRHRPLMAAQRESILVGSTDPVLFGYILRRLSHAMGMAYGRQFRINETPAESCVLQVHIAAKGAIGLAQDKWCAGHTLNTACYKRITHPSLNGLCRAIHCLQTRATQTIDRLPGHVYGQTCQQQSHARHITVILASLVGTP